MAVTRREIRATANNDAARFFQGAAFLSTLATPYTPNDLNGFLPAGTSGRSFIFDGGDGVMGDPVSYWDLLSWWHMVAMDLPTGGGNRAHSGPIFLPWHRLFLRRLEGWLQSIWQDEDLALPYWDWSADGSSANPTASLLWTPGLAGEASGTVVSGAIGQLVVRLTFDFASNALLAEAPHRIDRDAGGDPFFGELPTQLDEAATVATMAFDGPPWGRGSSGTFRNRLEGFEPPQFGDTGNAWMHNLVHMWVGGDMVPGTSPNDPVFYLNHCNVDRLWDSWMSTHGRTYTPAPGDLSAPPLHRRDAELYSPFGDTFTAGDVVDPTTGGLDWYVYG